jgi:hypothetical protein
LRDITNFQTENGYSETLKDQKNYGVYIRPHTASRESSSSRMFYKVLYLLKMLFYLIFKYAIGESKQHQCTTQSRLDKMYKPNPFSVAPMSGVEKENLLQPTNFCKGNIKKLHIHNGNIFIFK